MADLESVGKRDRSEEGLTGLLGTYESDAVKRKKSEDGLLGLLGTYASDDEDEDRTQAESPSKKLKIDEDGLVEAMEVSEVVVNVAPTIGSGLEKLLEGAARQPDADSQTEKSPQQARQSDEADDIGKPVKDAFWLPPELAEPPPEPCPPEIQAKVADYITKQVATGNTISGSLRALTGYRNPDFLQHCVLYDSIKEFGSCFPPEVFDPYNLPVEDYYDRLAAEWQLMQDKRQADRAKSQRVDFSKGGTETFAKGGSGISAPTAGGLATQSSKRPSAAGQRPSKWDTKR